MLNKLLVRMLLLFFVLAIKPVFAEEDTSLNYMALFKGTCTSAIAKSINLTKSCKGIVRSSTYNNGRVSFAFHTEHNVVSFVGGKDEKPSNVKYKLELFKVMVANINEENSIKEFSATGNCRVDGDVTKKSIVVCVATTDDENEKFEFRFKSSSVEFVTP